MPYVTQSDLKGLIPDEYLGGALDDDGSGLPDPGVWDGISAAVDTEIDGRLKDHAASMAATAGAMLKAAATALALYIAYKRRGVANDANPWTDDAKRWQDRLDAIGKGEEQVSDKGADPASADVVGEASKLYATSGQLMV